MITSSSRHIRKLWRMVNAVVSARFRRRPPPPLGREMDCWAKPGNSAACRLPRPTVLAAPGRSVREKYQRQGSQQLVARRGAASGDGLSFARGSAWRTGAADSDPGAGGRHYAYVRCALGGVRAHMSRHVFAALECMATRSRAPRKNSLAFRFLGVARSSL